MSFPVVSPALSLSVSSLLVCVSCVLSLSLSLSLFPLFFLFVSKYLYHPLSLSYIVAISLCSSRFPQGSTIAVHLRQPSNETPWRTHLRKVIIDTRHLSPQIEVVLMDQIGGLKVCWAALLCLKSIPMCMCSLIGKGGAHAMHSVSIKQCFQRG